MEIPAVIWGPLLPLLLVAGAALVVLVVDLFLEGPERELLAWLSLLGLVTGGFASAALWGSEASTLGDRFVVDNYALFFNLIFCGGTALTVLMSIDSVRLEETGGEYYPLLLFAVTGMITMAAANDLIVLFLGLEVMSIAVYVLTGIFRNEPRSSEAALKYFLLGAFATGFLLFGIALLYGATGTTRLDLIANRLGGPERELAMLGAGLLLIGFGFKVAAVPFHVWTPDVYEGAPTSVTALMAVGVKAAAFAAFARVFGSALVSLSDDLSGLLWVLAAATMTVGNVLAIAQSNIKRMLAYSSIAHAGYLLMGLVAATPQAGSALLFYLFAYAVMNLGAFAVVLALGETDGSGATHEDIESYSGIGFRQPLLGMAMAAFMLSARRCAAAGRLHREILPLWRGHRGRLRRPRDRGCAQQRRQCLLLSLGDRHDVHEGGDGRSHIARGASVPRRDDRNLVCRDVARRRLPGARVRPSPEWILLARLTRVPPYARAAAGAVDLCVLRIGDGNR